MFPNFTPEGLGLSGLMALVAVLHVFVAHFAVGGGLYLVLTERLGRTRDLPGVLDHARRHTRFFVLLTLVFGALSGVGIWFVIGLVAPDTTFALIRTFVWAWAAEWCFFVIELSAAIVYYKTWDRIAPRTHMAVGWLYAISTLFTLLIINGILTFMLTSGSWPETRDFWDGFFNPSYLPQTLVRIGLTISIAGTFGLLTAGHGKGTDEEHRLLLGRAARWVVIGILISVPGFLWTKSVLPAEAQLLVDRSLDGAKGAVPLLGTFWRMGGATFLALALICTFLAALKPARLPRPAALALLLLALFGYGCGEYAREVMRKPYSIGGYMYSNGIKVEDVERLRAEGFLASTRDAGRLEGRSQVEIGRIMYDRQCSVCHTVGGYRGVRGLLDGWSTNQLSNFINQMSTRKPGEEAIWKAMPPIVGNAAEVAALKAWLAQYVQ